MISPQQAHEAVLNILKLQVAPPPPEYGPNDAVSTEYTTPYPPVVEDLARLYAFVRNRKVTTVLEFGSGYSTAVFAHAITENKQDFANSPEFKALRRNNPFELHTVDCSGEWLKTTLERINSDDRACVQAHQSNVTIGTFNDRICHYYESLPNVCPDMIYLDGPMQHDAAGEIGGTHFRHNDRTVIAADIARLEWLLLPGTLIVVDGRTNNARFLKANFQREWRYEHDAEGDVHIFELIEAPLGGLNKKQLQFSLGR
jgi:hypothetical protein